MSSILIATNNPAKLRRYQTILLALGSFSVLSPQDLELRISIEENGATAAENARLKASTYASTVGLPALGIDEALYIPALPADQQPGVLVRRSGGRALTDEELLKHFQEKASRLVPEQRGIRWLYAICLALPAGQTFQAETGWSGWLSDQPCLPYPPGYPLSSILLDGETRKPLPLLTDEERHEREAPLRQAVRGLLQQSKLVSL